MMGYFGMARDGTQFPRYLLHFPAYNTGRPGNLATL